MKTPWRAEVILLLFLVPLFPLTAGQLVWTPGGERPELQLSLGDGVVRKALVLPSGAATLNLVLKRFLIEDERLVLVWKSDGALWMRQFKKMPGDEATQLVVLPPGKNLTLEIATQGGTPLASIRLRRN